MYCALEAYRQLIAVCLYISDALFIKTLSRHPKPTSQSGLLAQSDFEEHRYTAAIHVGFDLC